MYYIRIYWNKYMMNILNTDSDTFLNVKCVLNYNLNDKSYYR